MVCTTFIIGIEQRDIDKIKVALKETKEIRLVGSATSISDGMKIIVEKRPNLLFLEVELSRTENLELLNRMGDELDWPMHLITYTSDYACVLPALRASAFDCLIKPLQKGEILFVTNRFLKHQQEEHPNVSQFRKLEGSATIQASFMVGTITGFHLLKITAIGYFEYQQAIKCWCVYLNDGSNYLLKRTTKGEDIVQFSNDLIQINQFQIINLNYLDGIVDKECLLYPPFDVQRIFRISRRFYKALQEKLNVL